MMHKIKMYKRTKHNGDHFTYYVRMIEEAYNIDPYTRELEKEQNYIRKLRAYMLYKHLFKLDREYVELNYSGVWDFEDLLYID